MEEDMLNFFPHGIKALLVDDDSKFLKSATTMLSLLQFKVATCSSPNSALRLLSGDKVKDVDVVLADAHQVAACGFNLCAIVELDLTIPVIYFMASESPIPAADAAQTSRSSLDGTVQSATFIIKKPLDVSELSSLWRVVAWRKCALDARREKDWVNIYDNINDAPAQWAEERVHYKMVRASGGGRRSKQNSNDIVGAASSETQKHRVMWTPCLKQKFEQAVKSIGIGGHPSEILDHMNVKGLRRHHVASYLQKYRAKLQKKNERCSGACNRSPCSADNPPKESPFIQSPHLPTPNIPSYNSQIFTGGVGPSTGNAAEDFTGENDATALPPSWHPPLFQEPSGNSVINNTPAPAVQTDEQQSSSITKACNISALAFAGGNDAPALSSWSPSFQQPVGDVSGSSAVPVAILAEEQPSSLAEASNVAPVAFTGNAAPALSSWSPSFQQPVGDVSGSSAVPVAMLAEEQPSSVAEASNVAPVAFTGNAAPAVPPWSPMFHQHIEDVSGINALAAAMQEEQLSSGAIFSPMFFGSFTYQGPFPPLNTFDVQGEVQQQQQGEPEIQPLSNNSMGDHFVGATAGAATTEGDEAALTEAFVSNTPFVAPDQVDHGVSVAEEEHAAAAMAAEMITASADNGPAMASYDDGEVGPMVIAADEGFTFDELEAFLGLETPMDTDGAGGAAADGSRGFLNGEEGGSESWDLGTDQGTVLLDEIFRDNIGF